MRLNNYLVLVFAICVLYFYAFKYKGERLMKFIGIVIGISGVLTSLSVILGDKYYYLGRIIKNVLDISIAISVLSIVLLLTIYAIRERKKPERKLAAYFWLVTIGVSLITIVVVFIILPKLNY